MTQFNVLLSDAYGAPCVERQVVSAKLTLLMNCSTIDVEVECDSESPASYTVSYQASIRGRHELSVEVNGRSIAGSPFRVYIQQPPQLMGTPVRKVEVESYRAAVTEGGQLLVTSKKGVSVYENKCTLANTFEVETCPCGIAVDDNSDMYVTDSKVHKVVKLSLSGEILKSVGGKGSDPGELNCPHGIAHRDSRLFVCDRDNHRIIIFDLDLNVIGYFGCFGTVEQQFKYPVDLCFDIEGNMYVVDSGNNRVQVFSPFPNNMFVRVFHHQDSCGHCERTPTLVP